MMERQRQPHLPLTAPRPGGEEPCTPTKAHQGAVGRSVARSQTLVLFVRVRGSGSGSGEWPSCSRRGGIRK